MHFFFQIRPSYRFLLKISIFLLNDSIALIIIIVELFYELKLQIRNQHKILSKIDTKKYQFVKLLLNMFFSEEHFWAKSQIFLKF